MHNQCALDTALCISRVEAPFVGVGLVLGLVLIVAVIWLDKK
jgi:hypothetical protein